MEPYKDILKDAISMARQSRIWQGMTSEEKGEVVAYLRSFFGEITAALGSWPQEAHQGGNIKDNCDEKGRDNPGPNDHRMIRKPVKKE